VNYYPPGSAAVLVITVAWASSATAAGIFLGSGAALTVLLAAPAAGIVLCLRRAYARPHPASSPGE